MWEWARAEGQAIPAQRPASPLGGRWQQSPSARAHSHILSALPTGSFPGVDETEVYEFLDRHDQD